MASTKSTSTDDRLGNWISILRNTTVATDKLGRRHLDAGMHTLRFQCVNKSPDSKGYFLGFDALVARVPVYSRPANVDLRTLQKTSD